MKQAESHMRLSLFNRNGIKNYKIEQFNFEKIHNRVKSSLLNNVRNYKENLNDYGTKDYNHIVKEKDRKTLECFNFNTLHQSSFLFKVFWELIQKNSLSSTFMNDNNMEYTFKTRLNDMERMSFYVLQIQNNSETTFYFKRFSMDRLYLKKNIVFKVREATKLDKMDEEFLNLDTNFDFYLSMPNAVIQNLQEIKKYNPTVYIKNSSNFETILNFREIYDNHRDQVMETLGEYNIITNIDEFEQEFKKAKHRRKYIRIDYDEDEIKKPLKHLSKDIINQLENQTDSLTVTQDEGEISFEVKSAEGVEVFLDLLGEHILIAFDDSLQQVLDRSPIK